MFWNSSAGPPGFPFRSRPLETRSAISVISRMGSTSVLIFFSSPARSSAAIHSRKSVKDNQALLGRRARVNRRLYKEAVSNQPEEPLTAKDAKGAKKREISEY